MYHILFQVRSDEKKQNYRSRYETNPLYAEADNPDAEIQRFMLWAQKAGILRSWGVRTFVLSEDARHIVLAPKYSAFQKAVQDLCAVTLEQFERDDLRLEQLQIDLKFSIAEPHAYYFALDGSGPVPFAQFLRRAEPGKSYHISGTVLKFHN